MKKFFKVVFICLVIAFLMNVFNVSVFVGNTKIDRYFIVEQFEKINGKDIVNKAKDVGSGVKDQVDKVKESTK